MKEIKFRAWNKAMGWHSEDFTMSNLQDLINSKGVVIEQFTGLKDKNGKEVFEGDIVLYGKTCSFVVWSLDCWVFNSYMEYGSRRLYHYFDRTQGKDHGIGEIIGNIHENPELLK